MSSVNVETLLYEEIENEFGKLQELKPGSEEHKVASDTLVKFMDRAIELDKLEVDRADREAIRKNEQLVKQQEMKGEKKDRLVKNILTAAGITLPLLVTIWGTKVSLKFEETGTISTTAGRSFINKLFPKK